MPGSKSSNAPGNNSFAAFMPLKLRRECKEAYVEVRKSKVEIEI